MLQVSQIKGTTISVTEVYAEFDPNYLSVGRRAIDGYIMELGLDLTWKGNLLKARACQLRDYIRLQSRVIP